MSRRSRNLAGLAALGALGFMAGKGLYKRAGEELAPVDNRDIRRSSAEGGAAPVAVAVPVAAAAPQTQRLASNFDAADIGRFADVGTNVNESGDVFYPGGISAPAVTYRPRRGVFADDSQRSANAAADAMFENRAPAAAPRRRSSYDEENVFNPGQDIGPNISGEISRITGVKLDNPAGAGRSSGQGGASAEEIRQFMEGQGNVSAATARRTGVKLNNPAGAGRSSGRGGATARELEAYRRQQEELAKRGRGFSTTRRKEGGAVKAKPKKMASGGVSSASKRGDGIASKGKTKCKIY